MWQAQCDALPQRFQKAQRDAAKLIEPKVVYVTLPSATIHNDAELKAWLAQVEKQIRRPWEMGQWGLDDEGENKKWECLVRGCLRTTAPRGANRHPLLP